MNFPDIVSERKPRADTVLGFRVLFNWIPAFAGMTIGMNYYVLVTLDSFEKLL